MVLKPPTAQEFSLSDLDVERWRGFSVMPFGDSAHKFAIGGAAVGCIAGLVLGSGWLRVPYAIGGLLGGAVAGTATGGLLGATVKVLASTFHPTAKRYARYHDAVEAYERQAAQGLSVFWRSLSGREFEEQLGALLSRLGYQVSFTPHSGDRGVDLILVRGGRTSIVQCKAARTPVGPAVARELYGALIDSGADDAILACTAGVTSSTREFLRGKPMAVLTTSEIVHMALGRNVLESSLFHPVPHLPVSAPS